MIFFPDIFKDFYHHTEEHILVFSSVFLREETTETCSGKKVFLQIAVLYHAGFICSQVVLKIHVKKFIFESVSHYAPKTNFDSSCTKDIPYSSFLKSTYFPEKLPVDNIPKNRNNF